MGLFLELGPRAALALVCFCCVVLPTVILINLFYRLTSDASLPEHLPWAGVASTGGPWSRLKANLRSILHLKDLMDEGYTKYSKANHIYVLPHILTGPEVVLPVSQAQWLSEQPDHVLSQLEVNRRFLEADHVFFHPNIVREPIHPEVIKRELTHKLNNFADDIVDELHLCLEQDLGLDTEEWREINLYEAMLDIISRLSMRVLVGEELCKNKEFLRSARNFDRKVALSAAAINILPGFLKPIAAPFLTAYDYVHLLILSKFISPLVKERLSQLGVDEEKQLPFLDQKHPDDYIQWAINHARAHWDPAELTTDVITKRFASLTFAAIQSSVITITHTFLDIAASPQCANILNVMRDEVLSELSSRTELTSMKSSSPWGKASLARMVHVDSAIRESMRLNGFVARGIMKTVMSPNGVTLPDGTHIPQGVKVGIQAYSVHRDDDHYLNAKVYDAFRFVKEANITRSEPDTAIASGSDTESTDESCAPRKSSAASVTSTSSGTKDDKRPVSLVTTSPTFLAFSHGPNACPGRFFAANQMKLTLAQIALHYEIEPLPARPENRWFVGSLGPPFEQMIRVKRRKV